MEKIFKFIGYVILMVEKAVHYSGFDFLASILYYSTLEKIPADPGIEVLVWKAAKDYQEKHGEIVCKRKDKNKLQFLNYGGGKIEIRNYFKFIFPRFFSTTICLEDGFLHLTDSFREITEKEYIPYLTEEEKELAQALGKGLETIAKDLPAGNCDITTVDIIKIAHGSGNVKMIVSDKATDPESYKSHKK
jgi:hypothetical protein